MTLAEEYFKPRDHSIQRPHIFKSLAYLRVDVCGLPSSDVVRPRLIHLEPLHT